MLDEIKVKLAEYNQTHLIKFVESLSDSEQKHLINQINKIDFNLMSKLFKIINSKSESFEVERMISYETKPEYNEIGLEYFKKGKYAVVTMAGGQGTRLGYNGPKGTYVLGYGIDKSLFEIQCDKLKHIYELTSVYTPWYIMTSYDNHDQTLAFFKNNNYFEYPIDKINFFIQEELPMLDKNGKILMDSKSNIKMGANGSGGVFSSLVNSGLLNKMQKDHIEWIYIGGIDNILLPIDQPDLIGFAVKENFLIASQIIRKAYPEEKVGVFCKKNGQPSVIEYIEMTEEMNHRLDDKGEFVFGDAHILCNLFSIKVLEMIASKSLKYVPAFKKASYIDDNGNLITPDVPNAFKFETFIFDSFNYVNEVGLLRGERLKIFAPIKNATGLDSPETASQLYLKYYFK